MESILETAMQLGETVGLGSVGRGEECRFLGISMGFYMFLLGFKVISWDLLLLSGIEMDLMGFNGI